MSEISRWLISIYKPAYSTKLTSEHISHEDLANELRNGEFLCNFINSVFPDSIDLFKVNKNADSSRLLCCFNIYMFLDACFLNLNDLDTKYRFEAELLYDHVELRPEVIKFFVNLSRCAQFRAKSQPINQNKLIEEINSPNKENGIYCQFNSSATQCDTKPEDTYASLGFFVNLNDKNDLYINESKPNRSEIKTRDFVIREIFTTEETFISMLNLLLEQYIRRFAEFITYEQKKRISLNIEAMIHMHKSLYDQLLLVCKSSRSKTLGICEIFDLFSKSFIEIYTAYFMNLDKTLECSRTIITQLGTICEELEKENKFKLDDLLRCPFQRVLKYRLLLESLKKATPQEKVENIRAIEVTIKSFDEVYSYLNQTKADQESLKQIEGVINTLNGGVADIDLKKCGRFIRDQWVNSANGPFIRDRSSKMLLLFEKELIICQKIKNKHVYVDSLPVDESLLVMNGCSLNQNEFQLSCIHSGLKKQYHFNFSVRIHMEIWKKQFEGAIFNQTISNKNHKFDLTDFGKIQVECHVCNKLLKGIFFQGFKCNFCFLVAHKQCLEKSAECKKLEKLRPVSNLDHRKLSIISENSVSSFGQLGQLLTPLSTFKRQLKDYPWYLECNRKTCLQIFSQIPAENYHLFMIRYDTIKYTISIKSKNSQEVKHLMILEECDLNEFKYDESSQFFTMPSNASTEIQPRSREDSIKSIQSRSSMADSNVFFTMDKSKYFSTIVDLVNYYSNNSFSEIFEGLDKLEKAYRDALPCSIKKTEANIDYEGNINENLISLVKYKYYYVVEEFDRKMCRVYNEDGLMGFALNQNLTVINRN